MTDSTSNIVNLPTVTAGWYDSFINLLSGLGVMGRDKFAHQQYTLALMTVQELESAYRGDWLARKAVTIPAWDMTREWRSWQADPDQIKELEAAERKLFLQQRLQEALIKARLYGGAAVVIGVDAGKPEDELDLETVTLGSLKFLHVVSKNNIGTGPIVYDITSKYYGQPEYYEARTQPADKGFDQREKPAKGSAFNSASVRLHPSRVVKLIGSDTADQQLANVWGDSVLQAVNDSIKAAGLVSGSLATLCSELKIDVIKIPELKSILSTDAGTRKMLGRFEAANVAKSTVNTILLDGNEEWQRIQASLAGVPEIIATYMQVVSGAVDIPAGRFLGLPHRGLNVTGEADFRNYYDRLASEQSVTLQPAISVLDEVLIRSALGDRPENIFYEWKSLWQLSDGDKADIALKKGQTYQIDVNAGQLPPVALANGRANQLIEDGLYPGLEQALEDCAAEGDTIEEQNQPAPMPMMQPGVDPMTGQPADPNAPPGNKSVLPFKPKQPAAPRPGQVGQLPANARRSTAPGMRGSGDSADRPFDDEGDAGNECHNPPGAGGGQFCSEAGGGGAAGAGGTAGEGGDKGHPGAGYSKGAYVDKNGVIQTTKVADAQRALYENRRVNLDQPRKVSTLIKRLGQDVVAAVRRGEQAPNLNMCNVSVSGTNLFCSESKGIPRIKMPQLDEVQTKALLKDLKGKGYTVTKEKWPASHLKATQDELSGVKVWQQVEKAKLNPERLLKRLVISRDGYILDGHHHWAAKIGIDAKDNKLTGKMRVSRVNVSITDLLAHAKRFSGPGQSAAEQGPVKITFKKKKRDGFGDGLLDDDLFGQLFPDDDVEDGNECHDPNSGEFCGEGGGESGTGKSGVVSPHGERFVNYGGDVDLKAQGFKPKGRGASGTSMHEAALVAWYTAKREGSNATAVLGGRGWKIVGKGEKVPIGAPHVIVTPEGKLRAYRPKKFEEDSADSNECHEAEGQSTGGQFCSEAGGGGASGTTGGSKPGPTMAELESKLLSQPERDTITYYQGDKGFEVINGSLRKGNAPGEHARRLDSAINKVALTADTTVYRGAGNTLTKQIADRWRDKEPGDKPIEFTDKAFVSTSTSKKVAERFSKNVIELKLPKGTRALPIADRRYAGEQEILVGRGTKFRVTNVRKTAAGYRRITVELAA